MRNATAWQVLGWRHDLWDIVRYYRSLRGKAGEFWLDRLKKDGKMVVEPGKELSIPEEHVKSLSDYIKVSESALTTASTQLRTESEAISFCNQLGVAVLTTKTKSKDHHQSSKSLIAAVTTIASKACSESGSKVVTNPQRRCVWTSDARLHVSARNLDGAVPSLVNPRLVWEIKEYWGVTSGGSKMSDAVYECHLVGRDIREYEDQAKTKISHIVFLDGKDQWTARMSDLLRFIDLEHQGLIDHLLIGTEVETKWDGLVKSLI